MSHSPKVAIVTGASQGIGAGLVTSFLERGYHVVANSRRIERTHDSERLQSVAGDIADPETARKVVSTTIERFGRVDTLVNNAGIFLAKPFVDYSEEDFTKVMSVNVAGFFYVTQQAVRQMLKQGNGHVIQITTSLDEQPIKEVPSALANLSKGGLNSATRALAIEFADRGVRVNAVSPGVIKTPMHTPETHDLLSALHPMKRMGEILEIIDAVMYLESASFVTGEILHVDGGQHAGKW
ncbi:SDR family NAD(P)-dependent oxidoreductase [Bremerella alba]|uniref:Glucose 1-dehydrogenase n=1 Tax=Bremerella alba TaxID=980252 RepID=A0A7V9A9S7_9BACT|nr:SDR family oxidoreductase [Bremerella alba]MBA2117860.1 Glucose 1-dehydrogenase [Bremerella alba]